MARHSLAGVEGEVGVDLAHARNNSWSAATSKARPADTMVGRHAGVCAGGSWLCFSERLGLALSLWGWRWRDAAGEQAEKTGTRQAARCCTVRWRATPGATRHREARGWGSHRAHQEEDLVAVLLRLCDDASHALLAKVEWVHCAKGPACCGARQGNLPTGISTGRIRLACLETCDAEDAPTHVVYLPNPPRRTAPWHAASSVALLEGTSRTVITLRHRTSGASASYSSYGPAQL